MTHRKDGLLRRAWHRVFPRVPDFQGLVAQQCRLLEQTLAELAQFLDAADRDRSRGVRDCVRRAHALAQENLDLLHRSFVTRIDREDIYLLITRVDHVFDYATSSMRELELLGVESDRWMMAMVKQLREGAAALTEGFERFRERPADAEPFAAHARRAEREVEALYREALSELFAADAFARPAGGEGASARDGVSFILDLMKRREVYRHLSNAADRLAHVGEALHDLSVKYA